MDSLLRHLSRAKCLSIRTATTHSIPHPDIHEMSTPALESLTWKLGKTLLGDIPITLTKHPLCFNNSPYLRTLVFHNFPYVPFSSDWPMHNTVVHLDLSNLDTLSYKALDHDELLLRSLRCLDSNLSSSWNVYPTYAQTLSLGAPRIYHISPISSSSALLEIGASSCGIYVFPTESAGGCLSAGPISRRSTPRTRVGACPTVPVCQRFIASSHHIRCTSNRCDVVLQGMGGSRKKHA
ncbi:hypothetical protein BV25DRAFT_400160 [Artomyces pyxidatus]|uniref:Uncharacterized protein n=1 Tax=Artomyces pyxidatus TaxID=48021 RepID=A0ACB8T6S1_9AGAM|nr:hypothetical protein BV25DRAFT_400160 [Artomyces pyxidatus]